MSWFNRSKKKIHMPSVDPVPSKRHRKAIRSIDSATVEVHALKKVLVENGFTIHIARAAGGKH